ncbi:MAG: hypothetical protein IT195_12330 [Microthrixaceae bacterium]|nr:hypothetical protein [Microthrixaceae bacterium]
MNSERRVYLDRFGSITLRVGRTPIALNWTFLILVAFYTLVLGRPWGYGLMFAGVAFVGILWHETGHAVAFRLVGRSSRIVIHGIGGVTISEDPDELRDAEAAGVALAGPLVGIAVGLVALWLQIHDVGAHALWSRVLLDDVIFVNLGWGLLNLLPVIPLDGGQVLERLTGLLLPSWRHIVPYVVGIAVSLAGLGLAWAEGYPIAVLLAGAFALLNLRWMSGQRRARRTERADAEAADLLDRAAPLQHVSQGDLLAVLGTPLSPAMDAAVAHALAWRSALQMGPGDQQVLAGMCHRIAGRYDTGLLAAVDAHARADHHGCIALLARGFATESTPPPSWLVTRLLPGYDEVEELAELIDHLALGERHQGLSRLITTLEREGRTAEAVGVRSRLAVPVADDTFAWAPAR